MHKKDLALNNPQWLIYNKTQPNQTKKSDIIHHSLSPNAHTWNKIC